MHDPLIHVFLGANAQYIKTAPLLRLLDERGIDHRLIDSGQHALLSARVRRELGLREPDHALAVGSDVDTVGQAMSWSLRLSARLLRPSFLRDSVFGGRPGICVVHGDTPSTLLAALMASAPCCRSRTWRRGCAATGCCTRSPRRACGSPSCG